MPARPRYILKICGLTRAEDAFMSAALGADWLGFIFHPASPRRVAAAEVAGFETGGAKRVGVFVDQSPAEVRRLMAEARLDLAQLHGGQGPEFCREVGAERVIRVFWPQRYPRAADLEAEMAAYRDAAAYFIFDAGLSGGGHGRGLDIDSLTALSPPRPWLLAGGLTAAGARAAAAKNPAGLAGFDFNSKVETSPGVKDRRLVAAALSPLRGAGYAAVG
ncbi:MAG: phosphoribosylanthranilate isomerase [Candidatus Adiutrix sp.]|nr:phosphoribosylanthranilate isomerase [Candidatus Adiutrix sp.]